MGNNFFDRTFFGDLTQFDTTTDFVAAMSETVVTSDSLDRLLEAQRQLFEPQDRQKFDDAFFSSSIVGGPQQFDTDEATFDVSDSVDRTFGAFRTINDPTISPSDSVDRLLNSFRTISETVSLSDSVDRILGAFRTTAETVTLSDSVDRVFGAFRTITDTAVSVSDSVVRLLSSFRVIAEPAISVADAVARALTSTISLRFITRLKESLSFTTRIKDTEDVSI